MGRQVSTAIDSDADLFELSIRGTTQREWKITACVNVVMQKNPPILLLSTNNCTYRQLQTGYESESLRPFRPLTTINVR